MHRISHCYGRLPWHMNHGCDITWSQAGLECFPPRILAAGVISHLCPFPCCLHVRSHLSTLYSNTFGNILISLELSLTTVHVASPQNSDRNSVCFSSILPSVHLHSSGFLGIFYTCPDFFFFFSLKQNQRESQCVRREQRRRWHGGGTWRGSWFYLLPPAVNMHRAPAIKMQQISFSKRMISLFAMWMDVICMEQLCARAETQDGARTVTGNFEFEKEKQRNLKRKRWNWNNYFPKSCFATFFQW